MLVPAAAARTASPKHPARPAATSLTWPAGPPLETKAFTAREWDPETRLHYYRARYYDPRLGRFISEDPIGFAGGINFYAYVSGNPIRFADPLGLVDPTLGIPFTLGILEFIGHYAFVIQANSIFPGVEGRADLKRHCWANCASTRARGLNSAFATAGSAVAEGGRCSALADKFKEDLTVDQRLLQEIVDHAQADIYGQMNAWKMWESCETICEAVPGTGH